MAFDAYAKLGDLKGESTDDKHKDWIGIISFEHGIDHGGSATSDIGGRTQGKADFHDFSINKLVDASTPHIAKQCIKGKTFPKVEIEVCEQVGDKLCFLKFTLEHAKITGVKTEANRSVNGQRPTERVTLSYSKIHWDYQAVTKDGKASGQPQRTGWDVGENKEL